MHVVVAPGSRVVLGHVIGDNVPVPENAVSATLTLLIVTLPLFVTTNEYVTVAPAELTDVGVTDFTNESFGPAGMVTTALDGPDWVGVDAPGAVPDAIAVLVTVPAFASACVITYVAVQVVLTPGSRVVLGHVIGDRVPVPENDVSATLTLLIVTLPVLVTRNE